MQLYFTPAQIPELQPLPREFHTRLVKLALARLRQDSPFIYWLPVAGSVVGGLAGSLLIAFAISLVVPTPWPPDGNRMTAGLLGNLVGVGIGGYLAGYICLLFQFRRLRPYLRAVIHTAWQAGGSARSVSLH